MESPPRQSALLVRCAIPSDISAGTPSSPAGTGRHGMAYRPQDIRVRRRSAVRPVQHLQSPCFDGQIIGLRRLGVIEKTSVTFP